MCSLGLRWHNCLLSVLIDIICTFYHLQISFRIFYLLLYCMVVSCKEMCDTIMSVSAGCIMFVHYIKCFVLVADKQMIQCLNKTKRLGRTFLHKIVKDPSLSWKLVKVIMHVTFDALFKLLSFMKKNSVYCAHISAQVQ